jgi:polysaccharide export outer membrane protein
MRTSNIILKFTIAALLAFLMPLAALAQADVKTITEDTNDLYRIGPGDVLEVRVLNRPQLSRDSVRVDNRGMIRMPMIDDEIRAGCRTESELAAEIATRYLKYLRHPQIDVFVKEYSSNPVAVLGAVDKPGQFQLHRRVRLLELISLAGGPTERAGERVLVAHASKIASCDEAPPASENGFESYNLNNTVKGEEQSNPYARPGDIVTILEAQQAFVVGNVFKPGSIPLKERITVSQAVAMAGGTLPDTQKDRIRILRQLPGARANTEMVVDLNAISKRKAEDIELQPNDIIDVPMSASRRFLRSLSNAIAPTALTLPVRVIP